VWEKEPAHIPYWDGVSDQHQEVLTGLPERNIFHNKWIRVITSLIKFRRVRRYHLRIKRSMGSTCVRSGQMEMSSGRSRRSVERRDLRKNPHKI